MYFMWVTKRMFTLIFCKRSRTPHLFNVKIDELVINDEKLARVRAEGKFMAS